MSGLPGDRRSSSSRSGSPSEQEPGLSGAFQVEEDNQPTSQSPVGNEMDDDGAESVEELHSVDLQRRAHREESHFRVPLRTASLPRTAGTKKRPFGIPRDAPRQRVYTQQAPNPFDYEEKYPEDAWGKEFDDDARVWKVYMDEAELFDVELTEGWKDTVDVLLVFAGLFSAVVATLIGLSIQALQPDYAQATVAILLELVALQRAIASGNTAVDVPTSSFTLDSPTSSSALDRWVNGLWFTSLAISLCTALIATIIKQWIQQYRAFTFGSTMKRVHHRQFRYMSLNRWRVPVIIALLPSLLHVSLFVFLAGMSLFLIPLDQAAFYAVAAITCGMCALYLISSILPAFFHGCSYRTPISLIASQAIVHCACGILRILDVILRRLSYPKYENKLYFLSTRWKNGSQDPVGSLHPGQLKAEALQWLYETSSNSTVHSIIAQSIAGMNPSFDLSIRKKLLGPMVWHIRFMCGNSIQAFHSGRQAGEPGDHGLVKIERLLRGYAQARICEYTDEDAYHFDGLGTDYNQDMVDPAQFESILDISQQNKQLRTNLLLGYSLAWKQLVELDPSAILRSAIDPCIHPSVTVWAFCIGLQVTANGSIPRTDKPNEDVMWSAFSQTQAASGYTDAGYVRWSLLVRLLASLLIPRLAAADADADSALLLIKIKGERRMVAETQQHKLLTKALSCYLATQWTHRMDEQYWERMYRLPSEAFLGDVVSWGLQKQGAQSMTPSGSASKEHALADMVVKTARQFCVKVASGKLNATIAKCIIRLYISTFSRGVEPFTPNDAEVCLRIMALIPTSWYPHTESWAFDREMLRLWTSFLQQSLDMVPDDKAGLEALQFIQVGGDRTLISTIDSPPLQEANLASLLSLAMVKFETPRTCHLYFAQLRRLAQATRHALPSWRSAMTQVMSVSDGPAYLLFDPITTSSEFNRCIHQLLEDLKQLQGAGARDELNFQLYQHVRRISPDTEDDVHLDQNGQRSVMINGELWVVQPYPDEVTGEDPRGVRTLAHLSRKRCASALAHIGRRLHCVANHRDDAVV